LLWLAASAERYSEHPLAQAVRAEAIQRGIELAEPQDFEALPGVGVKAVVGSRNVSVGSARILNGQDLPQAQAFFEQGKSVLFVLEGNTPIGVLAAADTVRPEIQQALQNIESSGVRRIELLTGDNEASARQLANQIGISYQANLLPEDKIRIVREYQQQGRVVMMVGDGVNDAPALAQADVGVAMGLGGSDIAIETAPLVLMREDWRLIPQIFQIARRSMRVIRGNIAFTAVYNLVGLTLASVGILPPILAAAAQSLPDLGILANSARLIRQNDRNKVLS
jgi:Cd2+/Zn2+-exporting ATPase/Cu+-exporting ATPase